MLQYKQNQVSVACRNSLVLGHIECSAGHGDCRAAVLCCDAVEALASGAFGTSPFHRFPQSGEDSVESCVGDLMCFDSEVKPIPQTHWSEPVSLSCLLQEAGEGSFLGPGERLRNSGEPATQCS